MIHIGKNIRKKSWMHFRMIWGYLLFWIIGANQELIVINYGRGMLK